MISLLFPEATPEQIQIAKQYMVEYRKAKKLVETFPLSAEEKDITLVRDIERAITIILDDEVRRIIEFRYVKGNSHKLTRSYFSGSGVSTSTIDRKIVEGLTSIANSLLFCGQLSKNDTKVNQT